MSESCKYGGKSSKFKYQASGISINSTKSLSWSFDYTDCYGNNTTNTSIIDIKNLYTGSYMSADDMFTSKEIIALPYNIILK